MERPEHFLQDSTAAQGQTADPYLLTGDGRTGFCVTSDTAVTPQRGRNSPLLNRGLADTL